MGNKSSGFSVAACPWYVPNLPPLLLSKAELLWEWLSNIIFERENLDTPIVLAPYREGLINLHQVGPEKAAKLLPPDIQYDFAIAWQIFLQNYYTGIMPGTMRCRN